MDAKPIAGPTTVRVIFPDGEQEITAEVDTWEEVSLSWVGGETYRGSMFNYKPIHMPGWVFHQSVDGRWFARVDTNYQEKISDTES